MMDKIPVNRSPSRTPTSTPTKEKPTSQYREGEGGREGKRERESAKNVYVDIFYPEKSPEPEVTTSSKGKATSQPTTSRGTRGGVRYLGEEEEPKQENKVGKKKSKTSSSVSPAKQESKSTTRKSPVVQVTMPPSGKRQTTPTKGKSFAKSPSTTPKKSTPQPAPFPAAVTGTTPSLSRAQSYLRYKNRGGPRAPGSKQIPQGTKLFMHSPHIHVHIHIIICVGAENCLEGLTFVITGVLESLERDEATDIIKKYGGKVTTNVSGKTSYIVIGEEAGESKLAKVHSYNSDRRMRRAHGSYYEQKTFTVKKS